MGAEKSFHTWRKRMRVEETNWFVSSRGRRMWSSQKSPVFWHSWWHSEYTFVFDFCTSVGRGWCLNPHLRIFGRRKHTQLDWNMFIRLVQQPENVATIGCLLSNWSMMWFACKWRYLLGHEQINSLHRLFVDVVGALLPWKKNARIITNYLIYGRVVFIIISIQISRYLPVLGGLCFLYRQSQSVSPPEDATDGCDHCGPRVTPYRCHYCSSLSERGGGVAHHILILLFTCTVIQQVGRVFTIRLSGYFHWCIPLHDAYTRARTHTHQHTHCRLSWLHRGWPHAVLRHGRAYRKTQFPQKKNIKKLKNILNWQIIKFQHDFNKSDLC